MRSARRDGVEKVIILAFRGQGASVEILSPHKRGGCPDLVVGMLGITVLVEIKDPVKPSPPTEAQKEFAERWRGGTRRIRAQRAKLDKAKT